MCGYVSLCSAQRQLQSGRRRHSVSQTERYQRRVAGAAQGEERQDKFAPGK